MSRVESLELLGSLIDDLEPIGQMTVGKPLRAADWNTLVSALRNLARLNVSREKTTDALLDERYAARDHNHDGQMTLAWFEPGARTLLDEAMSGAVEQRAAVSDLRREITALRQEMAALKNQVDDIRIQFDGLRDEDAYRRRDMNKIAVRVEGLADVEDNLADLNTRFKGLGTDLEQAISFKNQLVDENGEPIDVAGLNNRMDEFEEIRNSLRTADGNIVNIRKFESSITRLEENTINRNDVDNVILKRLREGDILDEAGLVKKVATQVEEKFVPQFETITNTGNTLTSQFTELDGNITKHGTRLDKVENGMSSAMTSLAALKGVPDRLASHGTRISGVETGVKSNQTSIAELPKIRSRLNSLETRSGDMDSMKTDLDGLVTRVDKVESGMGHMDILSGRVSSITNRVGTIEQSLPGIAKMQEQIKANSTGIQNTMIRISANEAELDNLAGVRVQVDRLSKSQQEIIGWRTTVDKQLDDFSTRTITTDTIDKRVSVVESAIAETNTVVRRINRSVGSIEKTMPRLQALPDQLGTLNTRLTKIERNRIAGTRIERRRIP